MDRFLRDGDLPQITPTPGYGCFLSAARHTSSSGKIDLFIGRIGCPILDELGPDFLWREGWEKNR
jgi:hypothetical protein